MMDISPIRGYAYTAFAIAGLTAFLTSPAPAQTSGTNLIDNPGFTPTNGMPSPRQITVGGDVAFNGTEIAPWTAHGLVFLFGPAAGTSGTNADVGAGAPGHFGPTGGFCLWGPGSCGGSVPSSIQSPPNRLTLGPDGGNFVALDGALAEPGGKMIRGSISQTLNGLEVGVPTSVMFNWAAAQQAHFFMDTTQSLQVSLCPATGTCPSTDIQTTPTVTNPERGFRAWMAESFTFTPTSSSEVLTFLGIGTPEVGTATGGPPFILVESPSLIIEHEHGVPEPRTWSLLVTGFAAIAGLGWWRRRPKWSGVPA